MKFSGRGRFFLGLLAAVFFAACVPQLAPAAVPAETEAAAVPPAPAAAPEPADGEGVGDGEGDAAASAPAPEVAPASASGTEDAEAPPPAAPTAAETGYESVATYYAKRFNGRPTIIDEIYDPDLLTAATHELPLRTLARVVNPKNGREVVVWINDRPRKRKFPLIDLSRAAAKQLGFLGQGKITVRVIPLPPEAPEYLAMKKKSPKR